MSKDTLKAREVAVTKASPLAGASVRVTNDEKLVVEFRVEDLIRRLIPGGVVAGSCGGCNGCMGCSMMPAQGGGVLGE